MAGKNTFPIIVVILSVILAGIFYYFYNPANPSYYFPGCPLKLMTGLSCPGCGSQRAFHELLHFNFAKAFSFNPLLVFSIPYGLTAIAFQSETVKERFPKTRKMLFGQSALLIILAVILLFFIFRNI